MYLTQIITNLDYSKTRLQQTYMKAMAKLKNIRKKMFLKCKISVLSSLSLKTHVIMKISMTIDHSGKELQGVGKILPYPFICIGLHRFLYECTVQCVNSNPVVLTDLVYLMTRMARFTPFHERRPSMWSLAQIEIQDLSLVSTK